MGGSVTDVAPISLYLFTFYSNLNELIQTDLSTSAEEEINQILRKIDWLISKIMTAQQLGSSATWYMDDIL